MLKSLSVLLLFLGSANIGFGQTTEKKHRDSRDSLARTRQPGPNDTADRRILPPPQQIGVAETMTVLGPESYHSRPDSEAYAYVKVMPEFPGGEDSLHSYLNKNLKYPLEANDNFETVYIQFVVERDGTLSGITIARGFNKYLCNAAIECIKAMPKWIPGRQNGKAVRVKTIVPCRFRLE